MTNSLLNLALGLVVRKQCEPVDIKDSEVDNVLLSNFSIFTDRDIVLLNLAFVTILKIIFFPFNSTKSSWLFTNLTYNMLTLSLFHFNFGKLFNIDRDSTLDHLTIWEQLVQTKQFNYSILSLTLTPVIMFLLSLKFSNYERNEYWLLVALVVVGLAQKLKCMDRVRLFGVYLI
ncbi:hypothetical protein CONCODRAFT_8221 [Conidiobolus coronatus NRRL 28638]|uniref:Uncharacterized protein n=1 Tax=Conidiobolus coronatus (strain ATCC 28846 / CBS 209.66 / NRRL 28638) TaxID=796925 RepID=A0A137P2W9_CONC2|nr:hypothetical protein CONCODRAFT_8221 [Conidiobolus coronatus NRRL 28638]|eukprot:KXN69363.1 hypothetical protein CONCODRAFT_8221 [Conidiobolus coronatus NRRL 28638]